MAFVAGETKALAEPTATTGRAVDVERKVDLWPVERAVILAGSSRSEEEEEEEGREENFQGFHFFMRKL